MPDDAEVVAFLAELPDDEARARWDPADLAARIAAAHADASDAWPTVELDPTRFARRLGTIVADVGLAPPSLADVRPTEQYLVAACLAGAPRALQAFEAHTFDRVREVASSVAGVLSPAELEQDMREKLFAPTTKGQAMAGVFSGAASLRTWVRIVALRLALDARRSRDRRQRRHDALPTALPQRDPELELMRQLYTTRFEAILRAQLAGLEPRQRNLLRCQVIHHMRLDEIARLHDVHRATVARWISSARESLLRGVRAALHDELGLTAGEIDSVMRLIRSDVHASLVTRGLAESLPEKT